MKTGIKKKSHPHDSTAAAAVPSTPFVTQREYGKEVESELVCIVLKVL